MSTSISSADVVHLAPNAQYEDVVVSTEPSLPNPYVFSYTAGRFPGHIDRAHSEVSNGEGVVRGAFSYIDPRQEIRSVEYVADKGAIKTHLKIYRIVYRHYICVWKWILFQMASIRFWVIQLVNHDKPKPFVLLPRDTSNYTIKLLPIMLMYALIYGIFIRNFLHKLFNYTNDWLIWFDSSYFCSI